MLSQLSYPPHTPCIQESNVFHYISQVYCVNRKGYRPFQDHVGTKIDGTLEKYRCDPLECNLRHGMNAEIEQ